MSTLANPTPDATTDKPPRPRRWFPLSLRLFAVILLLLFAGSVLWIGVPAYRQNLALSEIERLGGIARTEPAGWKWLRDCVGEGRMRMFENVVMIDLGPEATDATLRS